MDIAKNPYNFLRRDEVLKKIDVENIDDEVMLIDSERYASDEEIVLKAKNRLRVINSKSVIDKQN